MDDTVKRILEMFGISEAERNLVMWNTGVDFSRKFSQGESMLKERLFWNVWKRLFTSDDLDILRNMKEASHPYHEVKDCLSTDAVVKRVFCQNYYAAKNGSRRMVNRQPSTLNLWRKRLIAAVGGYLELSGHSNNLETVKGVACRAAGVADFNDIPLDRLRSLYNAFVQRQNDIKSVNTIN